MLEWLDLAATGVLPQCRPGCGSDSQAIRRDLDRTAYDGCERTKLSARARRIVSPGTGRPGGCAHSPAAALSHGTRLPRHKSGLDLDAGALADRPQCRAHLCADRPAGADLAAVGAGRR